MDPQDVTAAASEVSQGFNKRQVLREGRGQGQTD
jgi:hypothetical protein